MKTYILLLILSIFTVNVFAQDTEKEKDVPVSPGFSSGYLIDNQTTVIQDARTLEFAIQHKFGSIENGASDLFGIYAAGSNIRLALNYVPVTNFQIGIGATKKNMYTDFNAKWTILKQTERNTVPVSLALYGVVGIDGRNFDQFGTGKVVDTKGLTLPTSVNFNDRLSYFSQVIVGRKFTDWLSLQVGGSFSHYNNAVWDGEHDRVAVHFNGRVKFSEQSSFIFNYDHPLEINTISEQTKWTDANTSLPNLCLGIEIATFTHAFQIYVGTADGILPQDQVMHNRNDWKDKGFAIGFNITRLWMF